jgi:hypothetical protein
MTFVEIFNRHMLSYEVACHMLAYAVICCHCHMTSYDDIRQGVRIQDEARLRPCLARTQQAWFSQQVQMPFKACVYIFRMRHRQGCSPALPQPRHSGRGTATGKRQVQRLRSRRQWRRRHGPWTCEQPSPGAAVAGGGVASSWHWQIPGQLLSGWRGCPAGRRGAIRAAVGEGGHGPLVAGRQRHGGAG